MGLAHVATADQTDTDLRHGTPFLADACCNRLQNSYPDRTFGAIAIDPHSNDGAFQRGDIMTAGRETIRLTVAQAIVRYLMSQFIEIDGVETRICGGGFGIFGHGNVPCLGEALFPVHELPLYRGQNEQSMGFAAAAYSKYHLRKRFMFCTASAGPGTANLLTASALAHANRLPMLMLCGDTFLTRLPDPVLQQLEHFGNPTLGLNDAFKAVTRFWDRITHPAQIIQSLPAALNTMLDPADCGPAFLALPQDLQGWAYDYPAAFFERRVHRIRRQAPDAAEIADAAKLLSGAKRPMIIAGGGVQYSGAVAELTTFADAHAIPVVETIAGRANMVAEHALNIGPVGVTGSDSANVIAAKADVILAVGTRLQDFTTGSWTAFAKDAKIIAMNVGRHDATKHLSQPVVGDAKLGLVALGQALEDYVAPTGWTDHARAERVKWDSYVATNVAHGNGPNSYTQAIGVVNELCDARDRIVTAAGGLPAEVTANWRTRDIGTVDVEFGFSCMGYEIAGGWGARIAQSELESTADTVVFVGDGSYLLMNSDIYSSVLTQKKLIVLVLDNGGFAVINKLQNNTGNESFNNLIKDCPTVPEPFAVDFEGHARSMGADAVTVANPAELGEAFKRAKAADKTTVIVMQVDPYDGWTTEGHTWWEVGTAEVSESATVREKHAEWESERVKQRQGI
jgi:3D-(3,5/4)-trihydroxycyclohexane-1,2-dione acylhydrolase (decyclizing)